MMMKKELADAFGGQLVFELQSAYLYLSFSAVLDYGKFPGAAHWMKMQADEEMIHANAFFAWLMNRNAEFVPQAIPRPETEQVKSPAEVFRAALEHEKTVSGRIEALAAKAVACGDFTALSFLNVFLGEQVQEEKTVQTVCDKLELAGDSRNAILFLDSELAARPAPAPLTIPAGA